ncbi:MULTISPECIES: alpha/beta hydrolase family protein [Roseomonadaceae]|uniref:Alpha/beta hydrolase n=1 Tax=Falsiroseomonas oleicola TaxID=2801474 RepID=A0ABS6H5C4_9PROT|nr:alpha/beta hydrolase [Roseomonas oleicola]MBU8543042.1 alpha/beta hydrolase [Roseomonas oleicola]
MTQDLPPKLNRRQAAAAGLTFGALALATAAGPAAAQGSAAPAGAAQQVPGGISYRLIGQWDVARLNRILSVDTPAFSGFPVTYTPARNAVRLYRISYPTMVPERGNKPVTLTGLLAIPDGGATSLPLVSYQHGTVYGKQEVPSFPENSPETQLMIAQFAGQGYALIGADYVGMGESTEPQGFMVKGSHQQATADLIPAARAVMRAIGLTDNRLFLAGWSQGGYVTMTLAERLEAIGMPVQAAATASAPIDLWLSLNGFLNFPRPFDAPWTTTLFILASFSFENYYGVPGLARSILKPEHYDLCLQAYQGQPFDPAKVPTNLRDLVTAPYFDTQFFAESAFGRQMAANHGYRWVIRTPVRNYYGERDEVITVGVGRLAQDFQRAMGNDKVEAISTGADSTHRGTYARAVPAWKTWFDSQIG